jgi:hypothetical protein
LYRFARVVNGQPVHGAAAAETGETTLAGGLVMIRISATSTHDQDTAIAGTDHLGMRARR